MHKPEFTPQTYSLLRVLIWLFPQLVFHLSCSPNKLVNLPLPEQSGMLFLTPVLISEYFEAYLHQQGV